MYLNMCLLCKFLSWCIQIVDWNSVMQFMLSWDLELFMRTQQSNQVRKNILWCLACWCEYILEWHVY